MIFDALDSGPDDVPELDLSEQRLSQMLGDIKQNSRNRRLALVAPLVLAAAVLGAMLAAPPQHGGLALADAEAPDPQLPRVFGSNGEWRLPEPITDGPTDPGPADMIEVQTEPSAPEFTLSPPDQQDLNSLPTSTSTPPTSTSGQSPDAVSPADLDWSSFVPVIRIERPDAEPVDTEPAETDPVDTEAAETDPVGTAAADTESSDAAVVEADAASTTSTPEDNTTPDIAADTEADTAEGEGTDVTVAVEEPQTERTQDPNEANPSTPTDDPTAEATPAFSTPATILSRSVLVYSAHVSVTVQVVDDDSSVIDWCNTRVDWGDGSVSRVAGADDAALCTASCEYESTSSAASNSSTGMINEILSFEHSYATTIDAAPRVFVATGDGCSYTLAELELPTFTVVPLP